MDFIRAALYHSIHGCHGEVDFPAYRVEHDKTQSHLWEEDSKQIVSDLFPDVGKPRPSHHLAQQTQKMCLP